MSLYKTPLRYPGGKQKIAPFIKELIEENDLTGGHYVEPYAGGAGVGIELLLTGTVSNIHLNDSCFAVYAFWKSITSFTEQFCQRIAKASLTVEEWRQQKSILTHPEDFDILDVGFSMFFLNRCNRSGILTGGVIGGLQQTGAWKMDARFPRKDLINRVEAIARQKDAVHLRNWDAERFIRDYLPRVPRNALVYCDPPYFNKAHRLYLNHYKREDHLRISKTIQNEIRHHWTVSYDNAPEIAKCYRARRSFVYSLQYSASTAYKGAEVFFFSDRLRLPKESRQSGINFALGRMTKKKRSPMRGRPPLPASLSK